ncbi:MAG TPA: hybrid sensor histidine kinase/response regulator [Gemmatimonadales bacterium]|jgi:CheY-like chemotaxis protein|nr:hybrid sensor histidine kinase/response regulator [Gemmatimonadales bacterium]
MELWVAFGFGTGLGLLLGFLFGRQRRPVARPSAAVAAPPAPRPPPPPEIRHVVLDEGSANVLNALNNRLSAIGALADLLHGSPLDPERARALMMLHGEVRRSAEITSHFLELADHPTGAAEPCDAAIVVSGVLAEREATFRELGVRILRNVSASLPMVACPMEQLTEMLTKLLDFSLRRLRDSPAPRELRIDATETGPSLVLALWDSGPPLPVEAEQRLVSPFRFTQTGGGGEVEFALARALAQSTGGSLRLRPRGGTSGAEVVVTLPKSVLGPMARAATPPPSLPKLRILVVDDDGVNRQAMELLLEREGHDVVAVENGLEAIQRLGEQDTVFDAVVTDLQMPRLGGRALYEQLVDERPQLAKRFVFVTGDQARDETRHFLESCGQPSVTKPYDLGDLITAIGRVTRRRV